MPVETTYYESLKLSREQWTLQGDEWEKVLQKAYKKSALEFHPDRHKTADAKKQQEMEIKFKDMSHAYNVLKEPRSRQIYDQYGAAGLEQQGGGAGGGMPAEELFAQFFGGGGFGGGFGGMFGGMQREAGPKKARTIHHVHKVSLEDIYKGKISKLALQKSVICAHCDGRGGKEGAVKTCMTCQGTGQKTMMRQMGPMIQRFQTVCPDCQGEGETIRDRDRCKKCMGKKTTVERKVLHVHVDKGVKTGHKIEFRGEGDQMPGVMAGDVVFEIEQKPHARFQRKEDDLFYHAEIDLLTAIGGGSIAIEHLDDRWLTVNIFPGDPIIPGAIKVVKGQGMPSFRHHDFGNLYIKFDVKFPDKTQLQNLELLEQVLPPRPQQPVPTSDAMVEDYDLEDVDPRQQARARGATSLEEEDDDMHPGAERVQCASQ